MTLLDSQVATWRRHPDVSGLEAHLDWCRARHHAESSIIKRRNAIIRLARALGCDPISVDAARLVDWQRTRVLSAISLRNEIVHVRAYYRWAVDEGLVDVDSSRRLSPPRLPRRLPRPISEADLRTAVSHAPRRIRPWLVLAAFAGLRCTEIAHLDRADVQDRADPPYLLIRGKGGHERVIPMGPNVLRELRAYGLPSRGPVFRRFDGRPGHINPSRLSHYANDYLHSLGITDTLHSLRHRWGTMVHRQSKDLRLTMELMGHADVATTTGYVAVSATHKVDAVAAVDSTLRGSMVA